MASIFKEFTNCYSISKTLRFELKLEDESETKKRFDSWMKSLELNETVNAENLIAKDYAIYNAYIALKPILDSIHEEYITISLQSDTAKQINFSTFFEAYSEKSKNTKKIESDLRKDIGKTFEFAEEKFFEAIKSVESKVKKSNKSSVLTDKNILSYIEKNKKNFVNDSLSEEELEKHLKAFQGFFTYFSGYNINRANYYDCEEEKNTAVATRIVNDNLPIFCNNKIRFEKYRKLYSTIHSELKNLGFETKIIDNNGKLQESEPILDFVFDIKYFNYCLSQGEIEKYNQIIGNANFLINLFNQQKSKEQNFTKLPLFEKLRKQIGCGTRKNLFFVLKKDKESELTEKERNSGEILSVEKLLKTTAESGERIFNGFNDYEYSVRKLIDFLQIQTDWDGFYWSDTSVSYISNTFFANWHDLLDKLKDNKACASFEKKREEQVKLNEAVELSGLFQVLDKETNEEAFKKSVLDNYKNIIDLKESVSRNLIKIVCSVLQKYLDTFNKKKTSVLSLERYKDKNVYNSEDDLNIRQIKEWYDSIKGIIRIVGLFHAKKTKMKGSLANPEIENFVESILNPENVFWNKWYDAIRNFLTKKPQDDVKENMLKLNFGSSCLLGGWSDGQEKVKISTILKHDNQFYLCILKDKQFFDTSKDNNPVYKGDGGFRLILRNLKFQTLAGKGFVGTFGQGYSEMGKETPEKAMECLKSFIKDNYIEKYPILRSIVINEYKNKKDFDSDIQEKLKDCYECKFVPIDWKKVIEAEKKGDLFIFKISSKDFKEKSKGKKDLQTLYWESVFTENSPHQLCAGAEIFMRKPVAEKSDVIHTKDSILINKRFSDKTTMPDELYKKLMVFVASIKQPVANEQVVKDMLLNSELSKIYTKEYLDKVKFRIAEYDIEKDKRFYGEIKYFFHCPIKLNYNSKSYGKPEYAFKEINEKVNDVFTSLEVPRFIGLDRGEKNLVYLCEIDKNCNIVDCCSLNNINGTNYMLKLEEKAGNRQKSRQEWQRIDNISNLKDGYVSHVVHAITEKVVNEPSYIVLEDLSRKMMQGRQKIEKSLYQKFEVALAKKLNFVVEKEIADNEPGSVSAALQLTPPLNNYKDIENKRQFGIMFYTRANYTSVTDPETGWRKTIYLKKGSMESIRKQIIDTFSEIGFDGKDYYFEYMESNAHKIWRMYSGKDGISLPRFINELQEDKNLWIPVEINLVEKLNQLFDGFDKNESLLKQIKDGKELNKLCNRNETSWESLIFVINLIQQIRNNGCTEKDENFLYSPVRNEKGEHFDTREHDNTKYPADADANGAYNIARKGIIMHEHILQWKKAGSKKDDVDLFVSDEEWDLWLLDRNKWQEKLPYFASKIAKKQTSKMEKTYAK